MKRFNVRGNAKRAARRSTFITTFLLILSTVTLTMSASAAELVINGDFEKPMLTDLDPDSRAVLEGWTTFFGQNYKGNCELDLLSGGHCNDGTLVDGWSVLWTNNLLPGRLEIQHNSLVDRANPNLISKGENPFAYANSGEQKAELDTDDRLGEDTNVTMLQEFYVCPRAAYQLTYSWRSRTLLDNDNDVRVLADGTVVRINRRNEVWTDETINFVTQPGATDSGVAFVSFATGTGKGMSIDTVSITGPAADNCPRTPVCTSDDGGSHDGGSHDGGSHDGGSHDGGSKDGGSHDGGSHDGGSHDGGSHDGGSHDGGSHDGGSHDGKFGQCLVDDDSSDDGDDGACGICAGKGAPSSLTLLYDGNDFTLNSQGFVPFVELGLGGYPVSALIKVYNFADELLFSGIVNIGELFEINNLENSLRIEIIDPDAAEVVQTVEIVTSCTQPLTKFDEFGGITIWSGASDHD